MRRRALLAGAGVAGLAALAAPSVAFAHGIVGRQDLPIPRWLFAWAAAVVLVISFVGLAVLWPKPRMQGDIAERRLLRLPAARAWEILAGAIGVGLFVLTVYAGFAGVQQVTANWAPTFIYEDFWVGLAFASLFFGDVFRAFSPWR
ncbi:MAG TPA: fenitrothion hydrolase, partial [Solirubrobacteraceae bacterium]